MKLRNLVCRTVGCESVFGRLFEWPHRICDRLYAEPDLSSVTTSYGSPN